MDLGTIVGILVFGATVVSIISGFISAFQSRSLPGIYRPPIAPPVLRPSSSSLPIAMPPAPAAPAAAPDQYAEMRLAIRKELEADQVRSFRSNLITNLAISGFFYVAGVLTTLVVAAH